MGGGLTYASACSGVEAASLAWHPAPLHWTPQWFAEIEPFPCAVLEERFPSIPNLGDITDGNFIKEAKERSAAIDVFIAGTPCQAFSIAGFRKGLDDERGNLALQFCRTIDSIRPRWAVWENVPGVLSSNNGRDFGAIVGALAELGYNLAWRILDARYWGVAQRRRRVFLVAHRGEGRGAGAVLFERDSLRRDFAASETQEEDAAAATGENTEGRSHWSGGPHPSLVSGAKTSGGIGYSNQELFSQEGSGLVGTYRQTAFGQYSDDDSASTLKERDYKDHTDLICFDTTQITSATNRSNPQPGDPSHPITATGHPPAITTYDSSGGGDGKTTNPIVGDHANRANFYMPIVLEGDPEECYPINSMAALGRSKPGQQDERVCFGVGENHEPSPTLSRAHSHAVAVGGQGKMAVRRLLPEECEELQGMPRGWTKIPYRGKETSQCPDSPRYKAIGNSFAVPVVRWIGMRIQEVDDLIMQNNK